MYFIKGIKNTRCVGICDEPGGKAQDFDPENIEDYRSPQTNEERCACVARALEYYNNSPTEGEFGLEPTMPAQVRRLSDLLTEISSFGIEFKDWLASHSKNCRYCGQPFFRNASCQDVCKRPECQRRRKSEKATAYYKRKKQNPS